MGSQINTTEWIFRGITVHFHVPIQKEQWNVQWKEITGVKSYSWGVASIRDLAPYDKTKRQQRVYMVFRLIR